MKILIRATILQIVTAAIMLPSAVNLMGAIEPCSIGGLSRQNQRVSILVNLHKVISPLASLLHFKNLQLDKLDAQSLPGSATSVPPIPERSGNGTNQSADQTGDYGFKFYGDDGREISFGRWAANLFFGVFLGLLLFFAVLKPAWVWFFFTRRDQRNPPRY